MSPSISQQTQDLRSQIAETTSKIARLQGELHALDGELTRHLSQQSRCQQLEEICIHLEQLSRLGGADLFKEATGSDPEIQLQHMRGFVAGFKDKAAALERMRSDLQAGIQSEQAVLDQLRGRLKTLQALPGRSDSAYISVEQVRDMPYRNLPWSTFGEDELRFRRVLVSLTIIAMVFGGLVQFFKEPVEESRGVVVPERIARIIKKKQAEKQEEKQRKLELAAKKTTEKSAEKSAEKTPAVAVPNADVAGTRKSAESKGVLAFKGDLANMLEDKSSPRMGADAKISVKASQATGDTQQRSIIVSQPAAGVGELASHGISGSGGIGTPALNRQVGGSRGQRITEDDVKFSRVESMATGGTDRRLSRGAGPSRTDEEIQVIFDRYKSAIYRMYNRELRSNPNLRGTMMLRIVIAPDGSVSECTLKEDDLAAPEFSEEIVKRVRSFNFGAKDGVPAITILYPIEFLPPN